MLKKLFIISLSILLSTSCYAMHWRDLWSRPDEQAAKLLAQGKTKQAAKRFQHTEWKGVANYRARQFDEASKLFSQNDTSRSNYNRGNTLAHLGKFYDAIDAYERTLQIDPNDKDAKYNRDLLKKLLKQKKHQKKNQQQQNSAKNKKDNKQKQQASNSKGQGKNKQQAKDKQSKPAKNQQDNQQKNNKQNSKNAKNKQKSNGEKPIHTNNKQERERQRAIQQWLNRIPDDPGGLLRQKFMREHLRKQHKRVNL